MIYKYIKDLIKKADSIENDDPMLSKIAKDIIYTFISSLNEIPNTHINDRDTTMIIEKRLKWMIDAKNKSGKDLKKPIYKNLREMGFPDGFEVSEYINNGGIMYGPPGNGKTYMWKKLKQFFDGCYFTEISSSDIQSRGFGSSIEAIDKKYLEIKLGVMTSKYPFCIMFFDEINVMRERSRLPQTSAHDGGVATTEHFFTYLGETSPRKFPQTYILGATNLMDDVDTALKRDGRLGYRYFFGKPERDIIQRTLTNKRDELIKLYDFHISNKVIQYMVDISAGVINYSNLAGYINTLKPTNVRFYQFSKNRKRQVINLTGDIKRKLNTYISNISDDIYSTIKNSKILSNRDIDKTTAYTDVLFERVDFKTLLETRSKLEILIRGKRKIGKTTFSFKIVDRITSEFSKYYSFSFTNYYSQTCSVDSTSVYEKADNSAYGLVIYDEVESAKMAFNTDSLIIINIQREDALRDESPYITINGENILLV